MKSVINFFKIQCNDENEGLRFFNHFQSIGWIVGGKTPMVDWKASANKWILNLNSFKPTNQITSIPVPGNLQTNQNKNYDEPL